MGKRMTTFLFAILVICMTSASVLAHDVPDFERSGSITVYLEDEARRASSGTMIFYRVGEIVSTDGNYSFRLVEAFVDSGETLEDLGAPELARSLLNFAQRKNLSGTTVEINAGIARYEVEGDQLGLYLVSQSETEMGYNAIDPFLIAVPNWDVGTYVYDVNAAPKVEKIVPMPSNPLPTEPQKDSVLPQTGQLKLPVPVLAVLGLLLIGGGVMMRIGVKNKENEA